MVLDAQVADTPVGNPFAPDTPALEIPVAPVVVIVMFGDIAVFIDTVDVEDAAPAVLLGLSVCVPPAEELPAPDPETVTLEVVMAFTPSVLCAAGDATSIVIQKKRVLPDVRDCEKAANVCIPGPVGDKLDPTCVAVPRLFDVFVHSLKLERSPAT